MRYEDFELKIGPRVHGGVDVHVLRSPQGNGREIVQLPEDPEELWCSSPATRDLGSKRERERRSSDEVGGELFRAVFTGTVGSCFRENLGRISERTTTGLRILLRIDPPFRTLPWELLYLKDKKDFLSLGAATPVVRSFDIPRSMPLPATEGPLRILAVSSQPENGRLKLGEEIERISRALSRNPSIWMEFLKNPDLESFQRTLQGKRFHILHFLGHGSFANGVGYIHFFPPGGGQQIITGEEFATIVKNFNSLRLVTLNACDTGRSGVKTTEDPFAGVSSALALGGVPTVLAMLLPIKDAHAIAFSEAFYRGLASGLSAEEAAFQGRHAIYAASRKTSDWSIPVLVRAATAQRGIILQQASRPFVASRFQDELPDVWRAQEHLEPGVPAEEREERYFSPGDDSRVRYCPILFQSVSGVDRAPLSIDGLAELLLNEGQGSSPLILRIDFAPDLKETLRALVRKVAPTLASGQPGFAARWLRGTTLLSNFHPGASSGRPPELQVLDAINGLPFPEKSEADPWEWLLDEEPLLFIVDFSDLRVRKVIAHDFQAVISLALETLESFARLAASRGHRTLIGFPRLLEANDSARLFIRGADRSYTSAGLFAPGIPSLRLPPTFATELPEPLPKLLACNSNALGYTVLAYFLEQGGAHWKPRSEMEWLGLSKRLFDRGFHEIACRLEAHRRGSSRRLKLVSLSFDVERKRDPEDTVAVVDGGIHLPRSVRRGALVGGGGSGKTTTLQAIEPEWSLPITIDEGERRESWLPIYFSVADAEGSLWERLARSLRERGVESQGPGSAWEEVADWTAGGALPHVFASPLMLLVDGLDEVAPKKASALFRELTDLPKHCGILAATRPDGYIGLASGLDLVTLRPLSREQIEQFLRERVGGLLDLLNLLDRPVSGFLRNPFLLECLREVDRTVEEISEITEGELLECWLDAKRKSSSVGAEEWEQAMGQLAELALDWAGRGVSHASLGEEAWGWLTTAKRMEVIEELCSGRESRARFAHAKIQECFVAQALRQLWREPADRPRFKERLSKKQVMFTVPLLMGLLEPAERSALLTFLKDLDDQRSLLCLRVLPRKAALSLPGAEEVLERQRSEFDTLTAQLQTEITATAQRQDKIKEILQQKAAILDRLGPLDPRIGKSKEGTFGDRLRVASTWYRLGRYPVTNLEFAAFIEAGGYRNTDYWEALGRSQNRPQQPRYWLSEGYDRPNAPVVGVSVFEALAYCKWLSSLPEATQGGKYSFALPTVNQWLWAAHGADLEMGEILRRARQKLSRAERRGSREALDLTAELAELRRRLEHLAPFLEYRELGPVGLTGHQASGCWDLYGGIWEWCDEWIVEIGGQDRPSQAPDRHPTYVLGGPSIEGFDPTLVLSGGWFDPSLRFERIGFRVARMEFQEDEP
jgi:formylglycine-generating enzyme required for sulfatase activity